MLSRSNAWSGGSSAGFCAGPFRLDLGDVLYAPNCFRDGEGRLLMVGWMQEGASRDSSQFDYSGCLTLPRILTQQGMHLSSEWLVIC